MFLRRSSMCRLMISMTNQFFLLDAQARARKEDCSAAPGTSCTSFGEGHRKKQNFGLSVPPSHIPHTRRTVPTKVIQIVKEAAPKGTQLKKQD